MYAEIKLQIEERANVAQWTDVVTLNIELLGMIREEAGVAAMPFNELLHLTKLNDDSNGWVIAGIQ